MVHGGEVRGLELMRELDIHIFKIYVIRCIDLFGLHLFWF